MPRGDSTTTWKTPAALNVGMVSRFMIG